MIQDPTIFTNDGPMMTGTWYNPTNGDSFTVADSFFQDNQYIVKIVDNNGNMATYGHIANDPDPNLIASMENPDVAPDMPDYMNDAMIDA